MSHLETVRKIYERFARGDMRTILGTFEEDIEFRLAQGHPYQPDGKPWVGARDITENFFDKVGPEWQDWTFQIDAAVETADAIVVEGRYAAVYKPTGRPLDARPATYGGFAVVGSPAFTSTSTPRMCRT